MTREQDLRLMIQGSMKTLSLSLVMIKQINPEKNSERIQLVPQLREGVRQKA